MWGTWAYWCVHSSAANSMSSTSPRARIATLVVTACSIRRALWVAAALGPTTRRVCLHRGPAWAMRHSAICSAYTVWSAWIRYARVAYSRLCNFYKNSKFFKNRHNNLIFYLETCSQILQILRASSIRNVSAGFNCSTWSNNEGYGT